MKVVGLVQLYFSNKFYLGRISKLPAFSASLPMWQCDAWRFFEFKAIIVGDVLGI
jgi:hypothetical protein